MLLTATTEQLELVTGVAISTDWSTNYVDHTTTAGTPTSQTGNVSTATTTTIMTAPGASTRRQLLSLFIVNRSTTTAQTVRIQKDISGTEYHSTPTITLKPGESFHWSLADGFYLLDSVGRRITSQSALSPVNGYTIGYYKVGVTAEAIGVWHSLYSATGFPGAWAPGTPGVGGRATDGNAAGDAGCLPIPDPASGNNYLVGWQSSASVVNSLWLLDIVWVNSGLTVTTTTAQAITSVAFPARDINGSTNGAGYMAGILVTTATTNAGAITNCTLDYTNESGTAGRTGTMASFPVTAVAGTIVWFQLAAGDYGVRSIQNITLGTSMVTGAISLIVARPIAVSGVPVVNVIGASQALRPSDTGGAGVKLWNDSCLIGAYIATATTATNFNGLATIEVR